MNTSIQVQNVLLEQPPLLWFQVFHQMLKHGCKDLFPLSPQSLRDVRQWCWVIRSDFEKVHQFIPKVSDGVEALFRSIKFTPNWENYFSMGLTLCLGASSCWSKKGIHASVLNIIVCWRFSALTFRNRCLRCECYFFDRTSFLFVQFNTKGKAGLTLPKLLLNPNLLFVFIFALYSICTSASIIFTFANVQQIRL